MLLPLTPDRPLAILSESDRAALIDIARDLAEDAGLDPNVATTKVCPIAIKSRLRGDGLVVFPVVNPLLHAVLMANGARRENVQTYSMPAGDPSNAEAIAAVINAIGGGHLYASEHTALGRALGYQRAFAANSHCHYLDVTAVLDRAPALATTRSSAIPALRDSRHDPALTGVAVMVGRVGQEQDTRLVITVVTDPQMTLAGRPFNLLPGDRDPDGLAVSADVAQEMIDDASERGFPIINRNGDLDTFGIPPWARFLAAKQAAERHLRDSTRDDRGDCGHWTPQSGNTAARPALIERAFDAAAATAIGLLTSLARDDAAAQADVPNETRAAADDVADAMMTLDDESALFDDDLTDSVLDLMNIPPVMLTPTARYLPGEKASVTVEAHINPEFQRRLREIATGLTPQRAEVVLHQLRRDYPVVLLDQMIGDLR